MGRAIAWTSKMDAVLGTAIDTQVADQIGIRRHSVGKRRRKLGIPSFRCSRTLEECFWPKVDKNGPNGCWEWAAGRDKDSYGKFRSGVGFARSAHRFAWFLAFGEIPEGLWVLHRCDNPPCCNPSHLFLGNAAQNNADMAKKGRAARGARNGRVKLTEEEVYKIRKLHATNNYTQEALSKTFGVSQAHISYIILGKSWAWLE